MGEDQEGSMNDGDNKHKDERLSRDDDVIGSSNGGLHFDDVLQDKLDELRPKDNCENKGDFVLCDMGTNLPFKSDILDGVISVSAIQWLC